MQLVAVIDFIFYPGSNWSPIWCYHIVIPVLRNFAIFDYTIFHWKPIWFWLHIIKHFSEPQILLAYVPRFESLKTSACSIRLETFKSFEPVLLLHLGNLGTELLNCTSLIWFVISGKFIFKITWQQLFESDWELQMYHSILGDRRCLIRGWVYRW